MPSKLKMAVSGCPNSCAEPAIKDIGVMGTARGYTLMVGGSAAATPRLAEVVAKELSEEEARRRSRELLISIKALARKKR